MSQKFLVAILGVVALGIGLQLRSTRDTDPSATEKVAQSVVKGATTLEDGPTSRSGAIPSHPPANKALAESTSLSIKRPESPSILPTQTDGPSQDGDSVDLDSFDANSVVGRPFPVSVSVMNSCDNFKRQGKKLQCEHTYAILARMQEEPRDAAWAPKAEAALRKLTMTEPDKYAVRNIECRTSICVAEYSAVRPQQLFPSHEFQRDNNLTEETRIFAYETDPSGTTLIITVLPFIRK